MFRKDRTFRLFFDLYLIDSPKAEAVKLARQYFAAFFKVRVSKLLDFSLEQLLVLEYECSFDMMAGLSPAAQDRLFFLGLGLTACAVIGLMRRMLIQYQQAAVIQPSESKSQYITQDVEDSLKSSTLYKLLDSPNYSIQETTAIIICERALHDGTTIDVLLHYITRPEHDIRERGVRALTMMMNSCKSLLKSTFVLC